MEKIEECKYCGSEAGYYRVGKVRGHYASWYKFDGSVGDNTEMHNGIIYGKEQATCYCQQCHKKIKVNQTKATQ